MRSEKECYKEKGESGRKTSLSTQVHDKCPGVLKSVCLRECARDKGKGNK